MMIAVGAPFAAVVATTSGTVGGGAATMMDRGPRNARDGLDRANAFDLGIFRIDQPNRACKARLAQIAQDHAADRPFARAGADQCDRLGGEQVLEAVGAHRVIRAGSGALS